MAYVYVKSQYRWVGLSTETKPTEGIAQGSRAYETDTGNLYIYNGSGWNLETVGVQLSGSLVADVTFHDAATAIATGTVLTLNGQKTLVVSIARTAGSSTVSFIGIGGNGAEIPIMGVNLSTLATATSTSGTGELWQFDITGLVSVEMKLTAISTGPITVKGRAVA